MVFVWVGWRPFLHPTWVAAYLFSAYLAAMVLLAISHTACVCRPYRMCSQWEDVCVTREARNVFTR